MDMSRPPSSPSRRGLPETAVAVAALEVLAAASAARRGDWVAGAIPSMRGNLASADHAHRLSPGLARFVAGGAGAGADGKALHGREGEDRKKYNRSGRLRWGLIFRHSAARLATARSHARAGPRGNR